MSDSRDLGFSRDTLYKLTAAKAIPLCKKADEEGLRFHLDELDDWAEEPVSATGSTRPTRAMVGRRRSPATDVRYPGQSPTGSESLGDGRSRSSSLEELSRHPALADARPAIPIELLAVSGV